MLKTGRQLVIAVKTVHPVARGFVHQILPAESGVEGIVAGLVLVDHHKEGAVRLFRLVADGLQPFLGGVKIAEAFPEGRDSRGRRRLAAPCALLAPVAICGLAHERSATR